MATNQMEKVVKLYKLLAQNPSLTGAKILEANKNAISVMSLWNQRNLERKANQRFIQEYNLDQSLKVVKESFPIDVTTELTSTFTQDGQQRAVLRQASIENSTKQFIEIWHKQRLIKNYDLAALDVHGEVYTDSEFGSFEWSPDGKKLLYIAEKKLPKSEPFYKQKNPDKNKEKNDEEKEKASPGNEYIYKPHWGEQLVGKHHPVIAVLDINQDTITVLPGMPDDLSPGQVIWTLDGQHVVGVAWKHEPRHLGLIFCSNRDSWIFVLKDGNYQKLSQDQCAVHSPRFSPDGKQLIWLEREAGGPHHNAHRLMRMRFDSDDEKKRDIIVDIVKTSKPIVNGKEFRGLYGRLPKNCWSSDSKYIFLSTPQETNIRSYIVDTDTSNIAEIQNDSSSLNVLDVKENVIAFLKVSLVEPWSLVVGTFNSQSLTDGNIKTVQVTSPMKIAGFEQFMYESTVYHYENEEKIKTFNFIYFGPKSGADKSTPLIVTPHGGPHSNFANTFSLELSLFALLGFAVVQVNFRGSTGMGSETVEYLQGKVGTTDVQDCLTATKESMKKYSWLDPERIALCGGSHGGFLVAHLSGQYPDLYKAVAARNPVIDIAAMFTISDIPDWCSAEINVPYVEGSQQLPDLSDIEIALRMLKCSPIIHVSKVKAPTLLCIGSNDLRVPPSQGKMWYHRLKANNVKTRMLVYEDNHSLGSANAEIDHIINTCLWFIENLCMNGNSEDA